MAQEQSAGKCEHCASQFSYWLLHSGFADSMYAYCDSCGKTAVLSLWCKRLPKLENCPGHQVICEEMEPHLQNCTCGGNFRKGASPRCPKCKQVLSAKLAGNYIEANAPATAKGWRWQRNWTDIYCIVIEDNRVNDNFY